MEYRLESAWLCKVCLAARRCKKLAKNLIEAKRKGGEALRKVGRGVELKSAGRFFGLDRESHGFDDAAVRFETDGEALPDIARLMEVVKTTDQPCVAGGFLMKNSLDHIGAL